jgi:hypothetical protein
MILQQDIVYVTEQWYDSTRQISQNFHSSKKNKPKSHSLKNSIQFQDNV